MVEMAVVLFLTGAMAASVVSLMHSGQMGAADDAGRQSLQNAEDALYGYALQSYHLPEPDQGAPSAGRPGFTEGWLPVDLLGLPASMRVRYMVDSTLTPLPADLYKADPLRLAGKKITPRTAVNGLDFCMALLKSEKSQTSLPDGQRLGFALQPLSTSQTADGATAPMVLDGVPAAGTAAAPAPRSAGYLEAAERLGCFKKLATLSDSVKSTASAVDTLQLAELRLKYMELQVKGAEETLLNNQWRLSVWTVGEATFAYDFVLTAIQMEQGPAGIASGVLNLASLTFIMAGIGVFIKQTQDGVIDGVKAVKTAEDARDVTKTYRDSLVALVTSTAQRANRLQNLGLQP